MKIIAPPQITDLDGLLELVLNPAKGIAYMQQLQSMRDNIASLLTTHETVTNARELLSSAQAKEAQATSILADAGESLEAVQSECSVLRQAISTEQQTWKDAQVSQRAELAARERTCQAQAQALDAQSQELTVREGALLAAQDAVTKRKAQLDLEYDKMMQRKALLSEIS